MRRMAFDVWVKQAMACWILTTGMAAPWAMAGGGSQSVEPSTANPGNPSRRAGTIHNPQSGESSAPPPDAAGFPSRDADLDVLPGFVQPPPGYSEVPFYWWIGDPLTKERLTWQLDELKAKGVMGLQVNYAHAKGGGGGFGMTYPSDPPLFSADWWKLWEWLVGECTKRGMAIGLSDYTLAWPGNGQWVDEIMADPAMRGATLGHRIVRAAGGKTLRLQVPENLLSVIAYRQAPPAASAGGSLAAVDLRGSVKDGTLTWDPPAGTWEVVMVFFRVVPQSIDPMNPQVGRLVIQKHFQRFEDHSPGQGGRPQKGLNYFFQDELMFGVGGNLWSPGFAAEFRKRKGYDILPLLGALFADVGPRTPKVRMDYSDVMVALSEEGYFRPVFDWHNSRGMLYGCDQCSRGLNVREYGDYFRCVRWFTAPGHDTPGVGANLLKGKVSSSIAHLYRRPRVWLEGYHSSGWGATPAGLMKATRENYVFGCSLLCLHGLYYTTHGGWWEWAPPCYHFRMPYWQHMGVWLKYFERLSYLLSQGVHRCDVAIMYPVAPSEAGLGGQEAVQTAFGLGEALFAQGIDFDFMDHQSLARAQVRDGRLCVAGEEYRVLILPAMAAVRHSTIRQALAFYRAGGVVIAAGCLPEASDRIGRDDPELSAMVQELFGLTAEEFRRGKAPAGQKNAAGGLGLLAVEAPPTPQDAKEAAEERWVWSAEATPRVYFKAVWPPPSLSKADAKGPYSILVKCDNECTVFVNGRQVAHFADYNKGWTGRADLKDGDVLTIDGLDHDEGNKTAGLFVTIAKGRKTLLTERDFRYTLVGPEAPDSAWRTGRDVSKLRPVDLSNVHPHHKGRDPARPGARTPLDKVKEAVDQSIRRDFIPQGPCYVLHRKAGPRDVYMVLNAAKDSECFFRAKGKVELWDPWTGRTSPIHPFTQDDSGTRVRMPLEAYEAQVIVFGPGDSGPAVEKTDLDEVAGVERSPGGVAVTGYCRTPGKKTATVRIGGKAIELAGDAPQPPEPLSIQGPWQFELKPTMDNRWGDFRIPAGNTVIGAEARRFRYAEEPPGARDPNWQAGDLDDSKWPVTTHGFGPRLWLLGPIPALSAKGDTEDLQARLAAIQAVDPAVPVPAGGGKHTWRPYEYSPRWGIEGDPGEQGYHGLKEIVSDAFLKVPANTYVWTGVLAPAATRARIVTGPGAPAAPAAVWINGKRLPTPDAPFDLAPGANRLLAHYAQGGRGWLVVQAVDAPKDHARYPLAMSWYLKPGVMLYDARPAATRRVGWYRFTSPPGLRTMRVEVHGNLQAWADGREMQVQLTTRMGRGGARCFIATVAEPSATGVCVALRVEQEPGYYAGSALPVPVALECGPGRAPLGDWSGMGVLANYSGGAWYRKTVPLSADRAAGRVRLDLGNLAATAEVHVNGKPAGVLAAPPWRVDVSALVRPGENRIEVLVYNTLANHYATIPTGYRGSGVSGLLGPVRIETSPLVVLHGK